MSCYHVNVEMSGCTEQCIVYLKGSFFSVDEGFPHFGFLRVLFQENFLQNCFCLELDNIIVPRTFY